MSGLQGFLGDEEGTDDAPPAETTREPKQRTEPEQAANTPDPTNGDIPGNNPTPADPEPKPEGEPEQPQPGHQVPRAALEAERRKRQEREAEAADLRRQLDEFKRQPPQAKPEPPQREQTDEEKFWAQVEQRAEQRAVEASINRELNRSERAARAKHGNEAVDAALAEYQRVYQMAPQVQQVVLDQPDPFEFIVSQSAHVREVGEFSRDGQAYRQRIEAELRAKWEAEMAGAVAAPQQPQRPGVRLQPSISGARSIAGRDAVDDGDQSLGDILRR